MISYTTCSKTIAIEHKKAETYCMRIRGHEGPCSPNRDSDEEVRIHWKLIQEENKKLGG